ncbi:MAG TPA: alpha/beta hydrolase [Thermoleophilaceae bacterium]|nr:alpha/beta hydrolase [Thermoleophilaceae bacterium]
MNRILLLALLAAVAVLTGCMVPRPPGDSPLRYRDQTFTNVSITRDIQYGSAPVNGAQQALRLDLYQPTPDTQASRPAVVWVHGGGFSGGDKGSGPSPELAAIFARLGYVTVSINYRLLGSGCTGASVTSSCYAAAIAAKEDAQAAVRWLRANASTYRIDPTRIGIGGESAGGITATLVGVNSESPGSSGNPGFSSAVRGFVSISGGLPDGVFAGAGDAAGLLFVGTADTLVPPVWSAQTAGALLNNGVPAYVQAFEGAGHVPWFGAPREQMITQSNYFLYTFLDVAHAAGQPATAAREFEQQARQMAEKYPRLAKPLRERYPALAR